MNDTATEFAPFVLVGERLEKFKQKTQIKKAATSIGIALILLTVISVAATFFIYFLLTKIFNFSFEAAQKILSNPAVVHSFQVVISIICFTVLFVVVFKAKRYRISELVSFKKTEKGKALPLYLLGVSVCAFANITVSYASAIFESLGINYDVDFGENPEGVFGFLLVVISTAVVPALVEEFALRGIVLGSLKKFGESFAILTSSIMFALMHGNFEQIPFALLVGMILGYITVKSGSLRIAVAVHFTNNFVSVAFSYLFKSFTTTQQNVFYLFYLLIALLLGIVAFLLIKQNHTFFKLENGAALCSEKEKYKLVFLSPTVIIFASLSILEAFSFFLK